MHSTTFRTPANKSSKQSSPSISYAQLLKNEFSEEVGADDFRAAMMPLTERNAEGHSRIDNEEAYKQLQKMLRETIDYAFQDNVQLKKLVEKAEATLKEDLKRQRRIDGIRFDKDTAEENRNRRVKEIKQSYVAPSAMVNLLLANNNKLTATEKREKITFKQVKLEKNSQHLSELFHLIVGKFVTSGAETGDRDGFNEFITRHSRVLTQRLQELLASKADEKTIKQRAIAEIRNPVIEISMANTRQKVADKMNKLLNLGKSKDKYKPTSLLVTRIVAENLFRDLLDEIVIRHLQLSPTSSALQRQKDLLNHLRENASMFIRYFMNFPYTKSFEEVYKQLNKGLENKKDPRLMVAETLQMVERKLGLPLSPLPAPRTATNSPASSARSSKASSPASSRSPSPSAHRPVRLVPPASSADISPTTLDSIYASFLRMRPPSIVGEIKTVRGAVIRDAEDLATQAKSLLKESNHRDGIFLNRIIQSATHVATTLESSVEENKSVRKVKNRLRGLSIQLFKIEKSIQRRTSDAGQHSVPAPIVVAPIATVKMTHRLFQPVEHRRARRAVLEPLIVKSERTRRHSF